MRETYDDRRHAGQVLAGLLQGTVEDVAVLALPRGGVPVAAAVADVLHAALDVLVVRKLGVPWHPELAMGAVALVAGHVQTVRNQDVLRSAGVGEEQFEEVRAREVRELRLREELFRGGGPPVRVRGRCAVVVDDGLATGATVRAAVSALRRQEPARIVVAVPVGAADALAALRADGVEVVCPLVPRRFLAVGHAYGDFSATSDEEVARLLEARHPPPQ